VFEADGGVFFFWFEFDLTLISPFCYLLGLLWKMLVAASPGDSRFADQGQESTAPGESNQKTKVIKKRGLKVPLVSFRPVLLFRSAGSPEVLLSI